MPSAAGSPKGRPILALAAELGIPAELVLPYGHDKAKLELRLLERPRVRPGPARLILVSAITPTPAGEGKTTTSIGLAQGLARLGASACLALREPSLGPIFGRKGGATGGGRSQLMPAASINLHFTGDFHAVTSAHNLVAAVVDHHLHRGNALGLDPARVVWRRVLDVNDRCLRQIVVGLGGRANGVTREAGFDITAASEIMAILCLARDVADLKQRLGDMVVGYDAARKPVRVEQLELVGALSVLLRDALLPNLVQTLEGVPALVHGGPFANIAHGCSSLLATRMALHLADWAITEAGFGFDLGAEKFFHIKCLPNGLAPSLVVLVTTVRALKLHGGASSKHLTEPDPARVAAGLPNLSKHIENIRCFGQTPLVAINAFAEDEPAEQAVIQEHCRAEGVPCAVSEHFARGGEGALELARKVIEHAQQPAAFTPLYAADDPVPEKILAVARKMYGAQGVQLSAAARRDLAGLSAASHLPICIAKTSSSLSDDPRLLGRPQGFDVRVARIFLHAGAGFLVVMTGDVLRMPGLPPRPRFGDIELVDGEVVGL